MTRLVLFTNDYPYATGDTVFVDKEIRDLAAAFDDVAVFCYARDTSVGLVDMPPNVFLAGNLFDRTPDDGLAAALRPHAMVAFAAAAGKELMAGRLQRNVRVFLMAVRFGIGRANRRALREAIAADPDTVAYAFWGMGGGLALPWLTGVRGRIVRLHRYDLYEDLAPQGYLPFRRFLFSRVDRVLAISEDAVDHLRRSYGAAIPPEKLYLSRLGVYGPDRDDRPEKSTPRLVVSCSTVSEVKRVDRIYESLRAMPGLSAQDPVRWVHFGDGPLLGALAQRVADAPEGLHVELRGRTPNPEILEFYAQHRVDLFVNMSVSEGVPVSIMEAIAHGIPVVATAVGGTPEIVAAELGSGELVSADAAPRAVGEVMRRVLDAPEDAYDPRALWRERYDARVTGPIAADLVRGVLGEHGPIESEQKL